jgi:hypothetical protein
MSETEKNLLADLINDRKNNSENIIEGKNTNSNNSIGKKTNNPLKKIHDQSKNNSQNNISNFKLNDTNIKLKFVTNNNNIDSGINNLKINEKNLIKEEREKHKKYSFDESAIDIFEDLKNYEDSLTENLNESKEDLYYLENKILTTDSNQYESGTVENISKEIDKYI